MTGNPLLAVTVLLVVAVALVPVFKWLGLGQQQGLSSVLFFLVWELRLGQLSEAL